MALEKGPKLFICNLVIEIFASFFLKFHYTILLFHRSFIFYKNLKIVRNLITSRYWYMYVIVPLNLYIVIIFALLLEVDVFFGSNVSQLQLRARRSRQLLQLIVKLCNFLCGFIRNETQSSNMDIQTTIICFSMSVQYSLQILTYL